MTFPFIKKLLLCYYLLCPFTLLSQAFFSVKRTSVWGAINEQGKLVIPFDYAFISDFDNEGRAVFKKNNLFGILSSDGKILVAANYDRLVLLDETHLVGWKKDNCAMIDFTGKALSAFAYARIVPFYRQLYRTNKDGKFGLIDKAGRTIYAPTMDKINPFVPNGVATTFISNGKQGAVNWQGESLLAPTYDNIVFLKKTELKATRAATITLLTLSSTGNLLDRQEWVNEVAFQQAMRRKNISERKKMLAANPALRQPRWVRDGFYTMLLNGVGRNLLKDRFFDVGVDDNDKYSLARKVLENGKTQCLLIDHHNAKVLFSQTLEDVAINDFLQNNWARATIDTLWDALVNKKGEIMQFSTYQTKKHAITNLGNFFEKRAWLQSGNKYGFIDALGEIIIPIVYDRVSNFQNSLAIAKQKGKFGAIDLLGKVVIPFVYDGILLDTGSAIFRVKKGSGEADKWGGVNAQNKLIIPLVYAHIGAFHKGLAAVKKAGRWGSIDDKGNLQIAPTLAVDGLGNFDDGIAEIGRGKYLKQTSWGQVVAYRYKGIVNQQGEILIPPIYENLGKFREIWKKQEGITSVVVDDKIGYINYLGEVVVAPIYTGIPNFDSIWQAHRGITPIYKDQFMGYINYTGEEILPPIYDSIAPTFADVRADSTGGAVAIKNGKYGLIDFAGATIIAFQYNYLLAAAGQCLIAKKDSLWGLIDFQNKTIIPFIYDGMHYVPGTGKQLVRFFKVSITYNLLDPSGNFLEETTEDVASPQVGKKIPALTYITTFDTSGYAIIEKKELQGITDISGNIIIRPKYEKIGLFSEGLVWFQKAAKKATDRRYGFLNKKAEEIIEAQFTKARDFSDGLAAVMVNGRWGYINKEGDFHIEPSYKSAMAFSDGLALVSGKIIIDNKGQIVGKFNGTDTISSNFSSGTAIVSALKGKYHIRADGQRAYASYFDQVTPFSKEVAFASKGQQWVLERKVGKQMVMIPFTLANKNSYIDKYGYGRTIKTKRAYMKDIRWRKVADGIWKMIGKDGQVITKARYTSARLLLNGNFLVQKNEQFGIATIEGAIIQPATAEAIITDHEKVIRIETAGNIYYLSKTGNWIWKE